MKKLLEYLLKGLVTKPKEIKIDEVADPDGTVRLTFSVAPEDMGLVIGKGGRTIMALRSLLKTSAQKVGKRIFLELKENSEQ